MSDKRNRAAKYVKKKVLSAVQPHLLCRPCLVACHLWQLTGKLSTKLESLPFFIPPSFLLFRTDENVFNYVRVSRDESAARLLFP